MTVFDPCIRTTKNGARSTPSFAASRMPSEFGIALIRNDDAIDRVPMVARGQTFLDVAALAARLSVARIFLTKVIERWP